MRDKDDDDDEKEAANSMEECVCTREVLISSQRTATRKWPVARSTQTTTILLTEIYTYPPREKKEQWEKEREREGMSKFKNLDERQTRRLEMKDVQIEETTRH